MYRRPFPLGFSSSFPPCTLPPPSTFYNLFAYMHNVKFLLGKWWNWRMFVTCLDVWTTSVRGCRCLLFTVRLRLRFGGRQIFTTRMKECFFFPFLLLLERKTFSLGWGPPFPPPCTSASHTPIIYILCLFTYIAGVKFAGEGMFWLVRSLPRVFGASPSSVFRGCVRRWCIYVMRDALASYYN